MMRSRGALGREMRGEVIVSDACLLLARLRRQIELSVLEKLQDRLVLLLADRLGTNLVYGRF